MRAAEMVRGRTARRIALCVALIGALGLLFLSVPHWRELEWGIVGTYDFVAYWGAARVVLGGGNPYNPAELLAVEQQAAGWPYDYAQWFWSPPWTLILTLPLAFLPFGVATGAWLLVQLTALLTSGLLLWRYSGPGEGHDWVGFCLALLFFPSLSALNMGQVSPLSLLALTGFLWAERERQDWLAGASLSLVMIKPHVVYLFLAAALWWAWSAGRRRVLVGWAGGLLGAAGLVLLVAPRIFRHYARAMALPPWVTPSIGAGLRLTVGVEHTWLQFLPSVLGGLGLLAWLWRRRGPWRWELIAPPLLLASVVTEAYGFSYDLVVLLPAVAALGAALPAKPALQRLVTLGTLLASQVGLWAMGYWGINDAYSFWYAPVLAGLYWWAVGRSCASDRI